jgi:glyoxylase-like metal-dependent hydrolase (beta-lactamase superfamily II)
MQSLVPEFRVGEFRCRILCDGELAYPGDLVSRGLSEADRVRSSAAYSTAADSVNVPYTALLVDTPRERILLDTGAGPLGPHTGRLPRLMQSAGIAPESVNAVILSHGHPDHIAGALDANSPRFPNARYIIGALEWEFWRDDITLTKCARNQMYGLGHFDVVIGEFAAKCLPPLADRLELVHSDTEVSTGVCAVLTPGHTPGHIAVLLASGNEQCLYTGDALVLPIQAEIPEWNLPFDLSGERAVATRRSLLDRAATDRMLVFAYHCPFPGLGHIERAASTWRWVS